MARLVTASVAPKPQARLQLATAHALPLLTRKAFRVPAANAATAMPAKASEAVNCTTASIRFSYGKDPA